MSKSKTKIGIYLCAILMMGVIAVSSNLANIMAAFPDTNPNTIVSYMISVPCFVIIIMSLVTGKLMDIFSKRNLMIFGILCWRIGGTVPYFMSSLGAMVIMRAVFGVGCGMVMSLCSALVAENFEDPVERGKVQGTMTSFQMLGAIFFSIVAGNLGSIGWNVAFLVHLMAIVSLIACIACIPNVKPAGKVEGVEKPKFQPTGMLWVWVIAFIIFMFAGQEYSNAASTLITEAGLGGSAAAGYSLALFAFGGFCMGFIFGKIAKVCGRFTLTVGCLLLALSYVIMAFAASLPVSYLGAFVCGLAFSICMPCIITGAAGSVGMASAGMAVALATCGQNLGQTLCSYVIPPLGNAWAASGNGLTASQCGMLVGAIIIVVFAIVFIFLNKPKKA